MQSTKGRGRGFSGMSPEKKHEIASMGGREAHKRGKAHKWTPGDPNASLAGKRGGKISRKGPNKLTAQQVEAVLSELAERGVI